MVPAWKERFIQKKHQVGDVFAIQDQVKKMPYRLYYDEYGQITCVTNDPDYCPMSHWSTADFTDEDIASVLELGEANFQVVSHIADSAKKLIIPKNTDPLELSAHNHFMFPVLPNKKTADVVLTNKAARVSLALSKKIKKMYDSVEDLQQVFNGHKTMIFVLCRHNRPYDRIAVCQVAISDAAKGSVKLFDKYDAVSHSIYTTKVFDTYTLINK